ncbi:MAG: hypothetical protein K2J75_00475 [Clostridia bacterium]|nr:hypothetical protein [Clostridia bacterium]
MWGGGTATIAAVMLADRGSFHKKLNKILRAGGNKKKDGVVAGYESEAQKQLAKMRAEMASDGADGNGGAGAGATGSAPSADTPSASSGSGDINIDDIV